MHLWSYQHPAVVETLQRGERYTCHWDWVPGERWQSAFRWMGRQMAERGIPLGEHPPVWAWHSVYRLGGKPDQDWADDLLFDYQLAQGIDLLELEVPDHLALPSCYGAWNEVLDSFIDQTPPTEQDVAQCFAVSLRPRRGRPPHHFPGIQVCLPYIDPAWLVAWETLNIAGIMEKKKADQAKAEQFLEQYKSIAWEFDNQGKLLVKLTQQ